MDVGRLIRERLAELELEQKDLAAAAKVTESYISQLLTRKKLPPAPDRTEIYDKIARFLKFPDGHLATLAELQRREELRRDLVDPPAPLYPDVREWILRKCAPARRQEISAILEREAFGALERLVAQTLLAVVKQAIKDQVESESWVRRLARLGGNGGEHKRTRTIALEFLDADVFNVSGRDCAVLLDPLVVSWDLDLGSFDLEIALNRGLAMKARRQFEFLERETIQDPGIDQGLEEFLDDASLSGDAAEDEIEFLRRLRITDRKPTALFYYRTLQNLRDPLHFAPEVPGRRALPRSSGPKTRRST
jgi:transcriptional regulator with XRE-family HTH domain